MMFFTVKNQFPESKQDAWQNVKNRVLIHCLGLRTRDETALVRKYEKNHRIGHGLSEKM